MTSQQYWSPPVPGQVPGRPAESAPGSLWFAFSIVVLVWSAIALGVGAVTLLYLGLGAIMTSSLDGVFGSDPAYLFNWILLWGAILGQVIGLLASILVAALSIGDRRRGLRRATGGVVMGFIAVGIFLLIGFFQIPLVLMLFDALAL